MSLCIESGIRFINFYSTFKLNAIRCFVSVLCCQYPYISVKVFFVTHITLPIFVITSSSSKF